MYNFGGPPMASTSENVTPFAIDGLLDVSNPAVQQPSGPIVVRLRVPEVWNNLGSVVIEMKVTNGGRELNPKLEYTVEGLDPNKIYSMHVHFERMNRARLSYWEGVWNESYRDLMTVPERTNVISLGTEPGAYWLLYGINGIELKMFNPPKRSEPSRQVLEEDAARVLRNEQSMINVTTRCRYVPVLEIYEFVGAHNFLCHTAIFDETKFVAVSEYKNRNMSRMIRDLYDSTDTSGWRPAPRRRRPRNREEVPRRM
ncbi:unnamed protein product [Caenorhabditis sp. 36 PRJEB53466]|nr:unnamed protein product [Caenorhabditis sp. 36 PRJEB53466]